MASHTLTELQTLEPVTIDARSYAVAPSRMSHERPAEASPVASMANTSPTTILSRTRAIIVITQLMGLTLFGSFCNGAIVVGLPAIATSLQLEEGLLLWPTSVFYLTAGSCLLMAGTIADVVGTKRVNLVGAFLSATFALAFGLARTGGELIAFRALQGVANAIFVPSSISIISMNMEEGRPRNLGFACLGFASTIGFSLGLVLGGILVDRTGWRPPFYLAGAISFVLAFIGIWALPGDKRLRSNQSVWKQLASQIDWIGAVLVSTGLAILSYVLATLSSNTHNIRQASNIVLLVISAALVPAFVSWMRYQVKHNRPALIPNSLWSSSAFTSICIMALFTTATTNCMELYSSLFFQEVQELSALGASLRILPSLIAGAVTNLTTGIFVNRVPVMWAMLISSAMSAVAPLLMALIWPQWPYWYDSFFAQILAPLSCDMLFTVGLLVVSGVFPKDMQALSGAVFNTCAQLGTAIGLTLTSVISTSVTNASHETNKASPSALMDGYRAVFWTMLAWMLALRALFDILTHHETYAEVESFKEPGAIDEYGFPFTGAKDVQGDAEKSSSPLLQLLLTRLVLPMPGIKDLNQDFWSVKFKGIMKRFADVDLSESYEKGSLGTRKTLATAASAFHESITRGMLGGVSRKADSDQGFNSEPGTATGLERAWDYVIYQGVYGHLVDELFEYAMKSDDFESHSAAVRDAVDYAIIHAATILHKVYVLSPEGQYLLKLIESTHKLIPYSMVCQTLRVGNAATMISGIMRIFLAKVSIGGLTNWMGITQNASDGQNLLQRIIAMVLGWDAGDFKKTADNIRNKKDVEKLGLISTVDTHLNAPKYQRVSARKESIHQQESIVTTILRASDGKAAAELTEQQHAMLFEYFSAQLSVQDRDKITQVMCRQSPDYVTTLIKELVAAFDPIIRVLHDNVDLRKYVVNVQKFIDDLLEVNKPKRDSSGKLVPPSIEDYVFLLRRHRKWAFEYLHEFAKGCPEVRERFRDWIKGNILESFKQDERDPLQNKSEHVCDASDPLEGAGSMSDALRSVFSKLDANKQQEVILALDRYDTYTSALDEQSGNRLQGIVEGIKEKAESGKDTAKLGSMKGPGVYHARWQWLLDETLITPATPSGPLRHGKDVKDVKSRGKTGALASKDTWDLNSIPELKSEATPEPPDVAVVLEALGPQFKDIVADISRRKPK
ncbi:putative PX domain-containing protein [Seiridium cardinale]